MGKTTKSGHFFSEKWSFSAEIFFSELTLGGVIWGQNGSFLPGNRPKTFFLVKKIFNFFLKKKFFGGKKGHFCPFLDILGCFFHFLPVFGAIFLKILFFPPIIWHKKRGNIIFFP